ELADAARQRPPSGRRAVPCRHRTTSRGAAVGGDGGRDRCWRWRSGEGQHGARLGHTAVGGHRDGRPRGLGTDELGDLDRAPELAGDSGCDGLDRGGAMTGFGHDPWWLVVAKAILVFVFLVLTVLVAILAERKLLGRMQMRFGPNRVGPFGLLQSLVDGVKLGLKEGLIPAGVDKPIYLLAPVISVIPAITAFAVIPFGPEVSVFGHRTPLQLTDLPVAVLYVLAVTSVGVYGIVLAGWASGSTYPLLGGLRSSAQVI